MKRVASAGVRAIVGDFCATKGVFQAGFVICVALWAVCVMGWEAPATFVDDA